MRGMRGLRFALLLALGVLALAPASPGAEERWKAFGARVMAAAPRSVQTADALTRARFVAARVSDYLATQGIAPNTSYGGRLEGAWKYGFGHLDRGSCGDVAIVLGDAFEGAGLKKDARGIVAQASALNVADVNRDHGALALVANGKVYLFDPWQYAREAGTFAGLKSNRWNGMPYDTWVAEMKGQGYSTFGLADGTAMKDWVDNETLREKQQAAKTGQGSSKAGNSYTGGFTGSLDGLKPADGRTWDLMDSTDSKVYDRRNWMTHSPSGTTPVWYARVVAHRYLPYPDQPGKTKWREPDGRAAQCLRDYRRSLEQTKSLRWVPDEAHRTEIVEDTLPAPLRAFEGPGFEWWKKLASRTHRLEMKCLFRGTDGRTERVHAVCRQVGNVFLIAMTGVLNEGEAALDPRTLLEAMVNQVAPSIR